MKKFLFSATLAMSLTACDRVTLSEAQRNAKQYTIEQINASLGLSMDDVDRIEVAETPDTVISTLPLSFGQAALEHTRLANLQGDITYDSLLAYAGEYAQDIFTVQLAAEFGADDSIKHVERWSNYLRSAYPVTVHMKSGDTRKVSVVMDRDGITPTKFRHKLLEEIEDYNSNCLNALDL